MPVSSPGPFAGSLSLRLRGEELVLLPDKALWWPRTQSLLVTDLHLGKATHFKRSGVYLPEGVQAHDLARLTALLQSTGARHLICLGDLFHSKMNEDWHLFQEWRNRQFGDLRFTLVQGNHDILPLSAYESCGLEVQEDLWTYEGLAFRHFPLEPGEVLDAYLLSGHLHPAVSLRGLGRQTLRLPCFWLGERSGALPAFGSFTGTHVLAPAKTDGVYVLSGEKVWAAQEREEKD